MARTQDYWRKRMEQMMQESIRDTEEVTRQIIKAYEKAANEISVAIYAFYGRWAGETGLSYQEAIKDLRSDEFKTWRMDIKNYIKEVNETGDEQLLRELNGLALRSRVNRLEELLTRIKMHLHRGANNEHTLVTEHLTKTYQDHYYKSIYTIQTGTQVGFTFAHINQTKLNQVLSYPWSGENYSNRIWNNRNKVAQLLKEELIQKLIQGKDNRAISESIAAKMDVSIENAKRLVDTETAFISTTASLDGFKESDVEEFEVLATLDRRTSPICQKQDGKVYKLSEAQVGKNCPPFHVRCRTIVVAYFGEKTGTRIARNENGRNIRVDANMTYKEWAEKYNVA